MVATVLIASCDVTTRAGLIEQLTQSGWTCVEAQTPEECKEIVAAGRISAAVLDQETLSPDCVAGLPSVILATSGAQTDGLIKPVRLRALTSALSGLLSAAEGQTELNARWRLHGTARILEHCPSGTRTALADKELALLRYLSAAGGAGATRDELLARVWEYATGADTHTVETHIHRLRAKLRDARIDDELVETTEQGYRIKP